MSRAKPVRLLVAYLVGGIGVTLIAGLLIVFLLRDVGLQQSSSVPPELEIAVGVLALLIAALVGTGLAARLRDWCRSRGSKNRGADASKPPDTGVRRGIEQLPGYEKLPPRVQRALASESPWIAWVAGVGLGMPNAYLLAAIAAILNSGVDTATQVAAILVFSFVAFAQAVIPLVSFLVVPDATRETLDNAYAWVNAHHRLVVTALATVAGVYLLIKGISSL